MNEQRLIDFLHLILIHGLNLQIHVLYGDDQAPAHVSHSLRTTERHLTILCRIELTLGCAAAGAREKAHLF